MGNRVNFDFKDTVVVITGASSGIGQVIAEAFAKSGALLAITGRRAELLEATLKKFDNSGYRTFGIPVDITDRQQSNNFISKVVNHFGKIDILVNNAGIRSMGHKKTIENITSAEWNEVLDTNLTGTYNLCQSVIPIMKERRGGNIINISSQAAIFTPELRGLHYIASKGGIISLTKGLAYETSKFGIRVNTIVPGFIASNEQAITPDMQKLAKKILEQIPINRWGKPEEIANTCLFLASDLSSYITGAAIPVNGGMASILSL